MKALFFLVIATLFVIAAEPVQAQTFLPTANKIIYSSNAVEVQDSTNKVAYVLKKGAFFVITKGFTGGTAAIIESHSQRAVWRGNVSSVYIVGVIRTGATSDSLKVLSLKSSPF